MRQTLLRKLERSRCRLEWPAGLRTTAFLLVSTQPKNEQCPDNGRSSDSPSLQAASLSAVSAAREPSHPKLWRPLVSRTRRESPQLEPTEFGRPALSPSF